MSIIEDLQLLRNAVVDVLHPIQYVCTDSMQSGSVIISRPSALSFHAVGQESKTMLFFHKDDYEEIREVLYAEVVKGREPVKALDAGVPRYASPGVMRASFFAIEVQKVDAAYIHLLNERTERKLEGGQI